MSTLSFENSLVGTLVRAVAASMSVVRKYQGIGHSGKVKTDGTVVTSVDVLSEEAGREILISSGFTTHYEEGGRLHVGDGDIILLFDPTDGSKPLSIGAMTSTVIAAAYSKARKRIIACVIGEPVSGRIWVSEEGKGTHVIPGLSGKVSRCHVWDGPLSPTSVVLADFYPGFVKQDAVNLPDTVWKKLFAALFGKVTGIGMFGSNGMHYGLLANGGHSLVGVITSALGGPWDVAPLMSVVESGGCAQGFDLQVDGKLRRCDPLDPFSFRNFAIAANNHENLERLTEHLERSCCLDG